ncbi:PEP-utilizing enzyme [Streptomyces sp. NPDC002701]|uniref:PEP-utilizing enzyme n=1 Tax=Streptomyces sp. NPDC002701 TaxID=3364661 RepID=UPI0036BC229A
MQELQVRLVRDAARRLSVPVAPGDVPDAPRAPGSSRVGLLRWPELIRALEHGALPADFAERLPRAASAPLPDTFRLAAGGAIVAERPKRGSGGDRGGNEGQGVSGGRAVGTAWDGTGPRPPDPVLVVRTLDPALAPVLPGLTGLVAQTGSPLSHLAVLAREFGLPTVVGVTDAVRRFPPGSRLTIDGTTGDVHTDDPRTAPPPSPVRPPAPAPAPAPAPIPAPTSALAPAPASGPTSASASAPAPVPGQVRRCPR